jgi:hypothetical protein
VGRGVVSRDCPAARLSCVTMCLLTCPACPALLCLAALPSNVPAEIPGVRCGRRGRRRRRGGGGLGRQCCPPAPAHHAAGPLLPRQAEQGAQRCTALRCFSWLLRFWLDLPLRLPRGSSRRSDAAPPGLPFTAVLSFPVGAPLAPCRATPPPSTSSRRSCPACPPPPSCTWWAT